MKSQIISYYWLVLLVTFSSLNAQNTSEKLDQDTIEGKAYYVYPFKMELKKHDYYKLLLCYKNHDSFDYKSYYSMDLQTPFSETDFEAEKTDLIQFLQHDINKFSDIDLDQLIQKIKNNPYPFFTYDYSFDLDIAPPLDSIPDGNYVQYFVAYPKIGENGTIEYSKEKKIAGYFSIKNNKLNGNTVWFNLQGDPLKKGSYIEGTKEGQWLINKHDINFNKESDIYFFVQDNTLRVDTSSTIQYYKNGKLNGKKTHFENSKYPITEGMYKDDQPVGEWIIRQKICTEGLNCEWDNKLITTHYTHSDTAIRVNQPLIRTHLFPFEFTNNEFYYFGEPDMVKPNFEENLFSIGTSKKTELISLLEGEFDLLDEYDDYTDDNHDESGTMNSLKAKSDSTIYSNVVWLTGKGNIPLPKVIDSLGIVFNYMNTYEKYYPNGQLMFHYTFKNGQIEKEDTIFWDNGIPFDVISYNASENQYVRDIYDYNGKEYLQLIYSKKGAFKTVAKYPKMYNTALIDGLVVGYTKKSDAFHYKAALKNLPVEIDSVILDAKWNIHNKGRISREIYYPKTRTLIGREYAVKGNEIETLILHFSPNFDSISGEKIYALQNIQKKTKITGILPLSMKNIHVIERVKNYTTYYETSNDQKFYVDNKPFDGKINFLFNQEYFGVLSLGNNVIQINVPSSTEINEKLKIAYLEYVNGANPKKLSPLLNWVSGKNYKYFTRDFIYTFVRQYFTSVDLAFEGYYEYEPIVKTIEGSFVNGKPYGWWKAIDQYNLTICEIPFKNGLLNGRTKMFKNHVATDEKKETANTFQENHPDKAMHYLSSMSEYKNGILNGKNIEYNWKGAITLEENYKDGKLNGQKMERNNLAFSVANYTNNKLDGKLKRYIISPKKDSTLIYDLPFNNGILNGEASIFHLNGKLAKKLTFQQGKPINTYEAYDSIGSKYHSIRFENGFPLEEKIWDENELSTQHLYSTSDSIEFNTNTFFSEMNLTGMLNEIGLVEDEDMVQKTYYAKSRLIRKFNYKYVITKFYPNGNISRIGTITHGKKTGNWKYYNYTGKFLYEIDYYDTLIIINDSIQFTAKGEQTNYNDGGKKICKSYITEKYNKYDCSHSDHYEIRQYYTFWERKKSDQRINGYVKNYYDNGTLQSEGNMKDGLPTGIWKIYDPFGSLSQIGFYEQGKRNGRWLAGDLSKTKYLGEICLNAKLPNIEEELNYRKKLLDIVITDYHLGRALNSEYYDVNLNVEDSSEN
jgi:antitoxin component YwqK of YwqJK toxin-antitoxin module